ncbi:hypothetical protein [uncultured Tenacibaculum sp.]|uniref:hypothetical protein n=1 Tax=uncultured Tenacibaculum sp. TaxID=174713 RepID=UPI002638411D|nr:hypothetical protein [uncultured Tenacibaculum sp.]
MKKIILSSLLIFLFTSNIQAQKIKDQSKIIDKQLEKVQKKLKIDNIQLLMIKEVVLKYSQEKIALLNRKIPDGEKRIQFKEINLKQEKELSQFLNEKQLIEFKKIMEKQQKKIRNRRSGRRRNSNRRGRRNSF